MNLGCNLPHTGPKAGPSALKDVAQAAETLGFSHLWTVDHLALPRNTESLYLMGPRPAGVREDNLKRSLSPLLECFTVLAFVAGFTERVHLSVGVSIVPMRSTLAVAREAATIDVLSNGRLELGVGAGWLREEAVALQIPWERRGARLEEQIAAFRTLWDADGEYVSYRGEQIAFTDIDPAPHPVQRPVPILVGGHSSIARSRAGRLGDGWIAHRLPIEEQRRGMNDVRNAAESAGRDPQALRFYGSADVRCQAGEVSDPVAVLGRLGDLAKLGVHQSQLHFQDQEVSGQLRAMEWIAKECGLTST